MDKRFLTIAQAAKLLGVSTLTLRNWDTSGKLPAYRNPFNNYRIYKKIEIEELLNGIESSLRGRLPLPQRQSKLQVRTDDN